jgi:site-specific recombinase XerD
LKNPEKDLSLIRVRMTIESKRFTYYLVHKIAPEFWDIANGCVIIDMKENKKLKGNPQLQNILRNINKEIENTRNALICTIEDFRFRDIHPSHTQIKQELAKRLGRISSSKIKQDKKEQPKFADFMLYLDYYITQCEDGKILNSKGIRLAPDTIRNYKMTRIMLKKYSKDQHIKLTFETMGLDFYKDLVSYLNKTEHSRGKYKPNAIGKFIKHIKKFMKYAYDNDYTQNKEFSKKEFRIYKEDVETIYLTENELKTISALSLSPSDEQVRDAFLISCYTGMRYSDISRLDANKHINFNENMITIITQKTNNRVIVPLKPMVRSILEKYDNQMPKVQTNQSTNRVLKSICQRAGLTEPVALMVTSGGIRQEETYPKYKLVTSHTARRSFATNAFKSGMPSISIMQITGHRTESSFMRYIRISKEENAKTLQNHEFFK